MKDNLPPFVNNEREKPIIIDDKITICLKCYGEKFEEHEEYDHEGLTYEGTSWTCERCGQIYIEQAPL